MRPELRISRSRFDANLAAVISRLAPSELLFVAKDDAYGHGLEWAARAAAQAGVHWFGGYDVATGTRIRANVAATDRILVLATSTDAEVAEALLQDVDLGVGTVAYLRRVIGQAQTLGRRARVHLKIDTGLHRNGFRPEDWEQAVSLARAAEEAGHLQISGVWSHLAEASDAEDDAARDAFQDAVNRLRAAGGAPEHVHLTASAASWWRPELRGSLSRVGAFCFGIRSADGPELEGVRPIATLMAPVVAVDGDVARIAIGAFDGLPSSLAGTHVVGPGGKRRLVRIDGTTSEVASWDGATVGDQVRIFGPGGHGEASATDLAERIGTVGEELLTRLTPRVRRVVED